MDVFRHASTRSFSKVIVALAAASVMSACGSAFRATSSSTQGATLGQAEPADSDQTTTISEKKPRAKQTSPEAQKKPTEQTPQSQVPAEPEVKPEAPKTEAAPAAEASKAEGEAKS